MQVLEVDGVASGPAVKQFGCSQLPVHPRTRRCCTVSIGLFNLRFFSLLYILYLYFYVSHRLKIKVLDTMENSNARTSFEHRSFLHRIW